jgi:hypothetical protein
LREVRVDIRRVVSAPRRQDQIVLPSDDGILDGRLVGRRHVGRGTPTSTTSNEGGRQKDYYSSPDLGIEPELSHNVVLSCFRSLITNSVGVAQSDGSDRRSVEKGLRRNPLIQAHGNPPVAQLPE